MNEWTNGSTYIVLSFTGLPASTLFGTVWIDTAVSFQPTGAQRGIFPVSPRGSYEGITRAIRQCRKKGIALEFLEA